ncbi:MAG: ribonuclease P protein component 1 [Nitrososphaeria archaeon]
MITSDNLKYHELICLKMKIAGSSIRSLVGLGGRVVMETKNMLYFDEGGRIRAAPKKVCVFEFELPSGELSTVLGSTILGRPEARLSRLR